MSCFSNRWSLTPKRSLTTFSSLSLLLHLSISLSFFWSLSVFFSLYINLTYTHTHTDNNREPVVPQALELTRQKSFTHTHILYIHTVVALGEAQGENV